MLFLQPCLQVDKQLLSVTDSELPTSLQQNVKLGPGFHGNPTRHSSKQEWLEIQRKKPTLCVTAGLPSFGQLLPI